MMARLPAVSNCRRPVGCGATRCGCMAMSSRGGSRPWPAASPSIAFHMGRSAPGSSAWITLSLQEGKNREVRRVLEHLGYPVTRLIRLAYGPFQLGHLARGMIEEVPGKVLQEQLGVGGKGARGRHARKTVPA